jgi:transcriptional regulator with XRE-family HTH domain
MVFQWVGVTRTKDVATLDQSRNQTSWIMADREDFAAELRWWRAHRRLSQLDLAIQTGISQRHLSFLELGRAKPGREMVARLAEALDVPLRQQNRLMVAAGFAPVWRQTDLAAPELGKVTEALDRILTQNEPFPAVVIDRHWNLLRANAAAGRLVTFLVGSVAPDAKINLADALVAPDVLRPYLTNWADVAGYFIRGVEADAAADGTAETEALLARLLAYDGVAAVARTVPEDGSGAPVLAMHFTKGTTSLRFFTTLMTLGSPRDITLQELRIECFFPMDDETGAVMRVWAGET